MLPKLCVANFQFDRSVWLCMALKSAAIHIWGCWRCLLNTLKMSQNSKWKLGCKSPHRNAPEIAIYGQVRDSPLTWSEDLEFQKIAVKNVSATGRFGSGSSNVISSALITWEAVCWNLSAACDCSNRRRVKELPFAGERAPAATNDVSEISAGICFSSITLMPIHIHWDHLHYGAALLTRNIMW